MFDPTAFENMKTVFEGAAYDLDLSGEAAIIGRNDIVDLAGMSRDYRITLTLPAWREASATVRLFAPFHSWRRKFWTGFPGMEQVLMPGLLFRGKTRKNLTPIKASSARCGVAAILKKGPFIHHSPARQKKSSLILTG